MLSRRRIVVGALQCATSLLCRPAFAQDFPTGLKHSRLDELEAPICGDKRGSEDIGDVTVLASSGDPLFDQWYPTEIMTLNTVFRVSPQFSIIDDHQRLVAAAQRLANGTRIYFAASLIEDEKSRDPAHWDSAVVGIMAHEWAHAFQYKSRLQEHVHIWEEHADFMAGWYLGTKFAAGMTGIDPDSLAQSLYAKGSPKGFWDPNDYGTPQERAEISMTGFRYGERTFTPGSPPDPVPAAQFGYNYLTGTNGD